MKQRKKNVILMESLTEESTHTLIFHKITKHTDEPKSAYYNKTEKPKTAKSRQNLSQYLTMKISTFFFAAFMLACLILTAINSSAQAPNYRWAKSAEGTTSDEATSVQTDASGNIIVVGYFNSPTLTLGSIILTNADTSGFGNTNDMFIVKYDAAGNVLWAKSAGGTSYDKPSSVSVDASGNITVVGEFFSPTLTFDTFTFTNVGTIDLFIVKYDHEGNVLWAKAAGGAQNESATSVTTDDSGNIIVACNFGSKSLTIGSTTVTNTDLNGNTRDILLIKFESTGKILWVRSADGISGENAASVTTDASGNIIVVGDFYSPTLTFDTITLTNKTGFADVFVVKFDADGNALWAHSSGGTSYDFARSVIADASGNIIVSGYFESKTLKFGSTTFTNAGNNDSFIVKYDAAGNLLWAKSGIGAYDDLALSGTVDSSGNIIAAGYFQSPTIAFGSTVLTNSRATAYEIFMVKFDNAGNVIWAKSAGGTSSDVVNSVTTDALGNIIAVGYYKSDSIAFGSTTFKLAGVSSTSNIFIVKLNSPSGIDEFTTDNSLSIAPNPFNSEIQIKGTEESGEITVLDVMGNEVIRRQLNSSETRINTEDLPTGVYMLKYVSEKRIVRSKLVKF